MFSGYGEILFFPLEYTRQWVLVLALALGLREGCKIVANKGAWRRCGWRTAVSTTITTIDTSTHWDRLLRRDGMAVTGCILKGGVGSGWLISDSGADRVVLCRFDCHIYEETQREAAASLATLLLGRRSERTGQD
jgi:hypothetical protein